MAENGMTKTKALSTLRAVRETLQRSTNRATISEIIKDLDNDEISIGQAVSRAMDALREPVDSRDENLEDALDILREAVAANRGANGESEKRVRDFIIDMNSIEDKKSALKKRKEQIKQLATNHRSKLNSDEIDKYNLELQEKIDEIDNEIRELRKEQDHLINKRDYSDEGDKPKMIGFTQQRSKSLGEFFIETAGENLKKRSGKFSIITPEYNARAATDTHWTGQNDEVFLPALTQVDRTVVQDYRRPTVLNLFRWGRMTGTAISYFYEAGKEGAVTAVAEKGKKPQLHYEFGLKTDALSKVAGFVKISEEMMADLPFIVTEINNRLVYDVEMAVEDQILNGSGTAPNILGLLNRTGVQTETSASEAENADALFKAATKIQTATGLTADGIVINPLDYQKLRLKRDANGQYFGGGFFQGQYGNGGLQWEPPIWGFRTIVSPAVAVGTALVGAFAQGATPYTKGGITVESTNSNEDDFKHNLVMIRAEQRIALAVRRPDAFVKVTLVGATGGAGL